MNTTTQRLDSMQFPLHGSRLIEASAGTGKTFTLSMLYLRLVLGHGEEAGFSRPLLPPHILVVTFTNAATEELRDRIRRRLVDAAGVFRGHIADEDADPLLLQLRDELGEAASTWGAYQLDCAAQWMDEAAISTIHGWCYRMLRDYAFDSGSNFEQRLENDADELLKLAVEDYWRCFYLCMETKDLEQVVSRWKAPDSFMKNIGALLPYSEDLTAAPPPQQTLEQCRDETATLLSQLKQDWSAAERVADLDALFDQAAKDNQFNKRSLNSSHRQGVLTALLEWINTPEQVAPSFLEKNNKSWRRMSSLEVTEIWKDPATAPVDHPSCQAMAALPEQLKDLPDPYADLLTHAVHWIQARLETEKQHQGLITQNDLLIQLDQALRSARGERLASAIRAQFPVALVDEFQDTDTLQYRIFDAIYRVRENNPEHGFFMIGDPKQAIYSFRGADIYTYLVARNDTASRHYTLDTNYRSSQAVIDAVNALFELGEAEAGRGAFRFSDSEGNPVPFHSVYAREEPVGNLLLDGRDCPPVSAWLIEDELTKAEYGAQMALAAAREIGALLTSGQRGQARLPKDGGGERPLKPNDIAVLVNNRKEADLIRSELYRLGVASVYLSERSNVFDTAVAGE